jgi:hypothetical protein
MTLTGTATCGDLLVSVERFAARRRGHLLEQEVCVAWRLVGERCMEIWGRFPEQLACDRFREGL